LIAVDYLSIMAEAVWGGSSDWRSTESARHFPIRLLSFFAWCAACSCLCISKRSSCRAALAHRQVVNCFLVPCLVLCAPQFSRGSLGQFLTINMRCLLRWIWTYHCCVAPCLVTVGAARAWPHAAFVLLNGFRMLLCASLDNGKLLSDLTARNPGVPGDQ